MTQAFEVLFSEYLNMDTDKKSNEELKRAYDAAWDKVDAKNAIEYETACEIEIAAARMAYYAGFKAARELFSI